MTLFTEGQKQIKRGWIGFHLTLNLPLLWPRKKGCIVAILWHVGCIVSSPQAHSALKPGLLHHGAQSWFLTLKITGHQNSYGFCKVWKIYYKLFHFSKSSPSYLSPRHLPQFWKGPFFVFVIFMIVTILALSSLHLMKGNWQSHLWIHCVESYRFELKHEWSQRLPRWFEVFHIWSVGNLPSDYIEQCTPPNLSVQFLLS